MCWYVLERYLYCLTNVSHYTPEFQKYSLGLGKNCCLVRFLFLSEMGLKLCLASLVRIGAD